MRLPLAFVLALLSPLFMVAALLRPSIFGAFYAIFSLICARGIWFRSRRMVWAFVVIFCGLVCCSQIAFLVLEPIISSNQISELGLGLLQAEASAECAKYNSTNWLLPLGIYRLYLMPTVWQQLRGLGPDVMALLSSFACWYFASSIDRRVSRTRAVSDAEGKHHNSRTVLLLLLLCMTSITDPSFVNLPYFITFLISLTVSCFAGRNVLSIDHMIQIKRIGSWFAALHLIAIYAFQLPPTNNNISNTITTSTLGIVNFFEAACPSQQLPTIVPNLSWTKYASVILLFALHMELCHGVRQVEKTRRSRRAAAEEEIALQYRVAEEEPVTEDQNDFIDPVVLHPPTLMIGDQITSFLQKNKDWFILKTGSALTKSLEYFYIFVPFAIVCWAVMFPSVLNLILMIMALGSLPFAGTPRRRTPILLALSIVSIILLIVQYCCSLNIAFEWSISWYRMGFGMYSDETAFRVLFFKTFFAMFVFATRAVDRRLQRSKKRDDSAIDESISRIATPTESLPRSRLASAAQLSQASVPSMQLTEWVVHDRHDLIVGREKTTAMSEMGAPLVALLACSVYVIGTYLVSIFNEQLDIALDNGQRSWTEQRSVERQWISMQSRKLWAAIWMPCTFLCILAIAFLKRFLMTIRLKHVTISSTKVDKMPQQDNNLSKMKIYKEVAVRFSKRHFWKVVAFSMTYLAANEVMAVFFPLMCIVLLTVIMPTSRSICFLIAIILLGFVWILRFLLPLLQVGLLQPDMMAWIGLQSLDDNWRIVVTMFLICTQCRLNYMKQNPCQLFTDIEYRNADKNGKECALFTVKYFFYKFGLEVSLIWSVCLATYRQDIVGMIYLFAVFVMIFCSRATLRRRHAIVWEIYGVVLALIFLIEYVLSLQLPPGVVQQYPWAGWREKTMSWFFLNKLKKHTADVFLMFGDLVQLMLVWSQANVFRNEPSAKGGDNVPLSELSEPISAFPLHCTDYVSEYTDLLSYTKKMFFFFSHWTTLIIILISATFDDSFFALTYTFGAFLFLWEGTRLYAQKSLPQFLICWKLLLYYNMITLFLKSIYIGIGSFYMMTPPSTLWLKTLLGLECKNNPFELVEEKNNAKVCTIITDVIIFTALICQIRILNSWYFQRVVVDYRADRVLKSSGTERINIMRISEDRENRKRVEQHLEQIKEQLDREDEMRDDGRPVVRADTHQKIKRSGSFHHVTEQSIPRELPGSQRADLFREHQPWWQPSQWFFNESISHVYVARRHEEDKRILKQKHLEKLLQEHSKEGLRKLSEDYIDSENAVGLFASSTSTSSEVNAQIGQAEREKACQYWDEQHIIVRVTYSLMAHSKMLCFVCLIIAHALRPTIITVPLPIFVFLWGALSIPRPSKMFFIACILYVGFIIQLRLIVQVADRFCDFTVVVSENATCPEAIKIGLNYCGLLEPQTVLNKLSDIVLLAVLLLHRYKVFRLGLWSRYRGDKKFFTRILKWVRALTKKKEPTTHDWYTSMVICDFLFIIVLVVFYPSIGEGGSGDLFSDVRNSIIPRWLAFSLGFLFFMMLVDRFVYLSKRRKFRLFYYLAKAIGFHAVFLIYLNIKKESASGNTIPVILYLIKCAYLLMCSWHIRHGYPSISSVDILDKKFWFVRVILMKIYLNIPLLVEVRAAMDYWLTNTSLSFSDWRRMENYHNEAAVQNCWIRLDKWLDEHFPTPQNSPTSKKSRWVGCAFLVVFLALIFSPLIFAYLKFVGNRMPPEKIVLTVRLQGYPVLYYMEAQHGNLPHLTGVEQDELTKKISAYYAPRQRETAINFLEEYDERQDIFRVPFPQGSLTEWALSPPGITQLLLDLNDSKKDYKFKAQIKLELYRSLADDTIPHVWSNTIDLTTIERVAFCDMIKDRSAASPVTLQFGLPPYIIAPNEGRLRDARPLTALLTPPDNDITFELKLKSGSSSTSTFWQMTMKRQSTEYKYMLEPPRHDNSSMVQLVVFVDKVFPAFARNVLELVGIGRIGMIGLVAFLWFAVGQKVLRPCFDTKVSNAALENLPNVDNILYLIRDIYLAREKKKWYLEKRLFQKLVFLFRSSETLIRWSRYTIKAKEH